MSAKKKQNPEMENEAPETEKEAPEAEKEAEQTAENCTAEDAAGEAQEATEAPEAGKEAPADDRYLRLLAEYDNYRKRSIKEKERIYSDARSDAAAKFLPVYDNLERAMKTETTDEAYKKGVEMTFNQLKDVFAKLGISEIEAVGQTFDPEKHNAVMHIEDENYGENVVVDEFQKGFMLGDKVIRCSMVRVAN